MLQNIKVSLEPVVGPTLIEMWAYAQLDEIINNADGLSVAVIELAEAAKAAILRGDSSWVANDYMFDTSLADEELNILHIVYLFFN